MADRASTRRQFLGHLSAGAAALAMPATSARAQTREKKPNIVFILIDDLGWADPACYGHAFHETPHIDRLADQGMRFTDAYAACPVCSPTRASIMAGQYPARIGMTDFITGHWRPYERLRVPINRTQYLPLEIETIAETLQKAGYTTGMFGKWHLGWGDYQPGNQGMDQSIETGGPHYAFNTKPQVDVDPGMNQAEFLTGKAIDFLRDHREESFCLFVHHFAVHIPLQADDELVRKYQQKEKPSHGINNPVYAAMMEHVDRSVGAILDELDALALTDNTMVVFFSDNGGLRQHYQGLGPIVSTNAPLRDEKGSLYEGGIRVPMIVRWPSVIKPGSVCPEPVSSVDFYPTLAAMAGAPLPQDQALDGVDLGPLFGNGSLQREALFWHYPHYHHSTPASAIRMGDWKAIEFFEDNRLELYNLAEDIGEATNRAMDLPETARDLRERLHRWRDSVGAELPVPNPDHDPMRAHEWGRHPSRG